MASVRLGALEETYRATLHQYRSALALYSAFSFTRYVAAVLTGVGNSSGLLTRDCKQRHVPSLEFLGLRCV
ncbi:hypothetical protein E2C01_013141 [Portunus trituberculatus]|uniref:Uncharacterized protein n=1 Tax=Portunus trituberculatus TaxID=210409 RepID=A0A5B7DGH4_PORTR|nr:hypothetical protein [Portunus trituberculatus]